MGLRETRDGFADLVGAALHRRGRVVQLVGYACRERTELGHLLTLAEHRFGAAPTGEDRVEHRASSGEARFEQVFELFLADRHQR